jgi:DNA-binding NarL/FixJ family response regulator
MVTQDGDLEVVGEAENALQAIRAVGQLTPHLVLMDITMPGMNGIETTAEIKRRYFDARVMMVTMHSNAEYVHAKAGADGYILRDAGRKSFAWQLTAHYSAVRGSFDQNDRLLCIPIQLHLKSGHDL